MLNLLALIRGISTLFFYFIRNTNPYTYKRKLLFIYANESFTINMDLEHKNQSYTVAFKLEAIKYAEDSSNYRAAKFYNIDRKRVQEWRKQKKELEPVKNKEQVRALKGRGRKAKYPALENELLDYIKQRREKKQAVTTFMIRNKAKELGQTLGLKDAKFSRGWVVRFKNRHNLVERARTQIAQKFPEETPLIVKNFLKTAREKTQNFEKKNIISFDETPMWFDMPRNSTIEFEGVREVPIRTTGSDKVRFTVVLGYTASGDKLPPTVIFKLKNKPKGRFP